MILANEFISISTGKNITAERWKATNKMQGLLKTEKEKVLKQSLELFRRKVDRTYNELRRSNNEVILEVLKNIVTGNNKDSIDNLLPIFDKHNADFKLKVTGNESILITTKICALKI